MENATTLIETTESGDAEAVLTNICIQDAKPPGEANNDEDMIDITSHLEECASSLTFTESLLCTKSFSLLDSMAALELMDPSMDCCEFPPAEIPTKLRRPPTSLAELPWKNLELKEAKTIIFSNLTALEALLNGSSVAESTYTCVYAHDAILKEMKNTEKKTAARWCVYASTLLLVKLSEVTRTIIQHADIYEEEDFVLNVFDFTFGSGFAGPSGSEDEEAEILLSGRKALAALDGVLPVKDNNDKETIAAAKCAISFMDRFYAACTALAKMTTSSVRDTAQTTRAVLDAASLRLGTLLSFDDLLRLHRPDVRTHDPLINRHLLGNAPVRKIKSKPLIESLKSLRGITNEISEKLLAVLVRNNPTLSCIQSHLADVSGCNILTRSLLLLNLYFDDLLLGQHPLLPLISNNMHANGVPQSLLSFSHFTPFLNRLAKPTYDILKLHLLNKNRQRGFIEALMLREWGVLQKEASGVDYYYREEYKLPSHTPSYVTNCVVERSVWIMERYVSLSVELKLWCGGYDYSMVFWYWDFLLSTRLTLVGVIKNEKLRLEREMERGNKKKGRRKNGKKPEEQDNSSAGEKEVLLMTLKRNLCRGIVRFLAAIYQAKLLQPPAYPFTSHRRRFQKRFEPFSVIAQPPPLTYDDFLAGSDFAAVKPSDLIASATECFKNAKVVVDKLLSLTTTTNTPTLTSSINIRKDEVMKFAKVCVGNMLFLHKLKQYVDAGDKDSVKVEFDWNVHELFCSIKVL